MSIVSLSLIRLRETMRPNEGERTAGAFGRDLREGIASVLESPVLRTIAGCTATSNFATSMLSAVLFIFAYRDLHLRPIALGLVLAAAIVGFVGAFFATRIAGRFGLGRTLAGSMLVCGLAPLLLPLALVGAPIAVLFFVELLQTVSSPIYNVNQVSLRQTIVPLHLQGRMNATMHTLVWGVMPLGALAGGALGTLFGIVPTLVVAGVISSSASLWLLCGPVLKLRAIDCERA